MLTTCMHNYCHLGHHVPITVVWVVGMLMVSIRNRRIRGKKNLLGSGGMFVSVC